MTDQDEDTAPPKPLFLQDPGPETPTPAHSPAVISWDDRVLEGGGLLTATYKKVARMLHEGHPDDQIIGATGISAEKLESLRGHPGITAEIARLADREHSVDVAQRLKDMGDDAANILEELLRDPSIPPLKKVEHARWLIEKLDGKAAQKIDVHGGVNIGVFMDRLDQIASKPNPQQVIDVGSSQALPSSEETSGAEPEPEATPDPLSSWLDSNLD